MTDQDKKNEMGNLEEILLGITTVGFVGSIGARIIGGSPGRWVVENTALYWEAGMDFMEKAGGIGIMLTLPLAAYFLPRARGKGYAASVASGLLATSAELYAYTTRVGRDVLGFIYGSNIKGDGGALNWMADNLMPPMVKVGGAIAGIYLALYAIKKLPGAARQISNRVHGSRGR